MVMPLRTIEIISNVSNQLQHPHGSTFTEYDL